MSPQHSQEEQNREHTLEDQATANLHGVPAKTTEGGDDQQASAAVRSETADEPDAAETSQTEDMAEAPEDGYRFDYDDASDLYR